MGRKKWLAAAVGALLVATAGIGAAMAQSNEGGTGIAFLDRVAGHLGIDRGELDAAIKDARTDQIDEAVANGDLTQEQADNLKERIQNMPADAPFFPGGPRPGFRGGHGAFGPGPIGMHAGEQLAEFLGITVEQLKDELTEDGATLASVAEAHGKSRDELKAFIRDEAETRLNEAVTNGKLTQEQADEMLAKLDERLDDLIDREMPEFGRFGPHRGFGLPFHAGEPLAEFLGITVEQLKDELTEDGATLASVAEAHGKSRDELKAFILEEARARADEMLGNLEEHLDDIIDREMPRFERFRGPGGSGMPFEGDHDTEGVPEF